MGFSPEGRSVSAPGAPASIAVEDWRGPDGQGDQGGWVLISFPEAARRDDVIRYRIEREIETTLQGYDEDGNEIHGETPVKQWLHWASIGPGADSGGELGGGVRRAVIPALDNAATRWGVRSVVSDGGSPAAVAGKRVFTRERIRQTLRLLGISPVPVLTDEKRMARINAPEDFVQSVIGDRKDLVFVPASPGRERAVGQRFHTQEHPDRDRRRPAGLRPHGHGRRRLAPWTTSLPAAVTGAIGPARGRAAVDGFRR